MRRVSIAVPITKRDENSRVAFLRLCLRNLKRWNQEDMIINSAVFTVSDYRYTHLNYGLISIKFNTDHTAFKLMTMLTITELIKWKPTAG